MNKKYTIKSFLIQNLIFGSIFLISKFIVDNHKSSNFILDDILGIIMFGCGVSSVASLYRLITSLFAKEKPISSEVKKETHSFEVVDQGDGGVSGAFTSVGQIFLGIILFVMLILVISFLVLGFGYKK